MGIRGVWLKLRALLSPGRAERELDDEIRFHLEMETEENLRRGMDAGEARRRAYVAFGGVDRFREETHDARGTRWLEDLARDAGYGLRLLARSPGFTTAALLTLALGVGATTATFSIVQGVLLRPLPFPEADELVTVWLTNPAQGIDEDITSWPNFVDWREQASTLEHVVAVSNMRPTLTGEGEPEELLGARVSRGFFEMLGAPLFLGRGFRRDEVEGDAGFLVVLSHELWVRRFGADREILGRSILLNGESHTVVGVTAPGSRYPRDAELWVPLSFRGGLAGLRERRGALWLPVVGRLADGVALEEAQAEMSAVARRLEEAYPGANEGMGIQLEPLRETLVGDVRTPLLLLMGAVAFVLLVGCANVGNLLLARGTARGREMAVRLSLGGGRGRLLRQVVTESALLGLLGGTLGTGMAAALVGLVRARPLAGVPRLDEVGVDPTVLAFALLLSLGTGVLFGLIPALQMARTEALDQLREGGKGSGGALTRLRPLFVASQFALAMVLLVGAGLLVRSFVNLQRVDAGFQPEGVLVAQLRLPAARYPGGESVREFTGELLAGLEALPGVEAAGVVNTFLLDRLPNMSNVALESRPVLPDALLQVPVTYDGASEGFLDAAGMELAAGRGFLASDGPDDPPVVLVNEAFVRLFLPGMDPLGERITFGNPEGDDPGWMTIVGVLRDARRSGLDQEVRPSALMPYTQYMSTGLDVVIRTAGDPVGLAPELRRTVESIDPDLPVSRIRTMEQAVAEGLATRRFLTLLLSGFAVVGTLLAAIGVYGVMAFLVGRRTREIGIRVALGAGRGTILGSVVREALTHACAGLAVGAIGALLLGRVVQSQLFGLDAGDPLTLAAVGALLMAVAVLAAALPAARATRVAPSVALRVE